MKLEITEPGVFDADGKELEIGATLSVDSDEVPNYLHNKVRILDGKTFVANPASEGGAPVTDLGKDEGLKGPFTIGEAAAGWYPVIDADGKKVKSLRAEDSEAFKTLSDEDKLAFLAD